MSRIIREKPNNRVPIIGHIAIGERVQSTNKKGEIIEIPRSLDYFKVKEEKYRKDFNKALGEKPNNLRIMFLSNDDEVSCDEHYELRVGKKLYSRGDGETFLTWSNKYDSYIYVKGADKKDMILHEAQKMNKKAKWEEKLVIRFILLDFVKYFGVWELSTKGCESSVPEIRSSYDLVKQHNNGSVVGVQFNLIVEKVTSNKVNSKSSFPVLRLIPERNDNIIKNIKQYKIIHKEG